MADSGEKSPLLGKQSDVHFCNRRVPLWAMLIMTFTLIVVTSLLCLVVFYGTKSNRPYLVPVSRSERSFKVQDSNKVDVQLYGESLCPYTTMFIKSQLQPTWEVLSDYINLEIVPFGNGKCQKADDDDYKCTCQHGPMECFINQLMNCVIDAKPDPHDYAPVVFCLQGSDIKAEWCLDKCGLDRNSMMECGKGKKGRQLQAQAAAKTPEHLGVPWIVVNGKYDEKAQVDLKGEVCMRLSPKPAACT